MSNANADRLTDEVVAKLLVAAGLSVPPKRLPAVAQRLRELHEIAATLDEINLGDAAPASEYDPSWPEAKS